MRDTTSSRTACGDTHTHTSPQQAGGDTVWRARRLVARSAVGPRGPELTPPNRPQERPHLLQELRQPRRRVSRGREEDLRILKLATLRRTAPRAGHGAKQASLLHREQSAENALRRSICIPEELIITRPQNLNSHEFVSKPGSLRPTFANAGSIEVGQRWRAFGLLRPAPFPLPFNARRRVRLRAEC